LTKEISEISEWRKVLEIENQNQSKRIKHLEMELEEKLNSIIN